VKVNQNEIQKIILNLASKIPPNIIDYVFRYHHHDDEKKAFSLCFGYDGGYLTVGGYNTEKHKENSKTFVISYHESDQYKISLTQLYVSIFHQTKQ
jgi:hypothetical protein